MSTPRKGLVHWALLIVRYGLCVGAIVFLVNAVKWHDRVRLHDADGPLVRLLEEHDDHLVIERGGARETIAFAEVHHVDVGGQNVPEILYGIRGVVQRLNWPMAILAWLVFMPVWLIQSARLVLMLKVQGVVLTYWDAVKLTYAGSFFNFALPGSTGGDLIKAYYVTLYTHSKKTEVVTTVFIDRAIGLLGLMILAAVALVIKWDPEQFGQPMFVLGTVAMALALGSIIVFSRRIRGTLRLRELVGRLPMGEQLERIGQATIAMRRHAGLVGTSLAITLALQAFVLLSAAIMAIALGMQGNLLYFMIYVSIGFLIAAIPINPPQAFGVMEGFYVLFFTASGVNTASQAVALALGVRLVQLLWALPGVLVPLLGAHAPSRDELEAFEHSDAGVAESPVES